MLKGSFGSSNFASPTDSLHENEVEEIIIDISQIKESTQWHPECCIYKVPIRLRKVMEQAYTPKLVSIGPVHHDNDELKDMQKLKKSYFKEFFSRTSKGQKEFASIVKKNIKKIDDCYAVEIPRPEKGEDLVKMILLDSIFIIELFLRKYERSTPNCGGHPKDYILNKPWVVCAISQDLRLLENQLPFFILEHLYDQSGITGNHQSFFSLACDYFYIDGVKLSPENEVKHFTDLHRIFFNKPKQKCGPCIEHRHNATKLDAAGLLFKKVEEPEKSPNEGNRDLLENRDLLDIKFEKPSKCYPCSNWSWLLHCLPCLGKLSCLEHLQTRLLIPQFVVTDEAEELFRNLMALEQCHYPTDAYICNYILLLDDLINSKEDVELLVEEGIIVNSLGSNEAVANMVNKLGQEIMEMNSYYFDVADAVNKHYQSPWNKNMASLKKVYFRDIWRGTATVGGVFVLIVTLLTFFTPFVFKIK